jgi:alanyl-tRNA synthetase
MTMTSDEIRETYVSFFEQRDHRRLPSALLTIVRVAAEVTGGGGSGRDTMARAGGRDPDKLPEASAAARAAIEAALAG